MVKAFCSVCGSSLFGGTWPDGPEVSIRLGALDGDPGIRPQYHSYVDSMAVWDRLPDDDLQRFPGAPGRRPNNEEIVRRHFAVANAGDYASGLNDFAADVVLDTRGFAAHPEVDLYTGPERVGAWFAPRPPFAHDGVP